ncbi:MAG: sigma-70 family RNA polymerase sigma factor [Lachnospiraceae bacterium]|nr:sigma-70 family RNA polymerase sigma factor [Lachnospiraceae bacterium]
MAAVKTDIEKAVHRYGDMLLRISTIMLGSVSDAEDVLQETIIRYIEKAPFFNDADHEKAWLIKVAVNKCKDIQRRRKRYSYTEMENIRDSFIQPENTGVFDSLMALPEKYRLVMLLFYVEGYSTQEIAPIIGRSASAVKMRLKKGRELLKEEYIKGDM